VTARRHSWGEPKRFDANNTVRTCKNCGLIRQTRHEPDNDPPHWAEFKRGNRLISIDKTPECR
jgi:hypothetical protein